MKLFPWSKRRNSAGGEAAVVATVEAERPALTAVEPDAAQTFPSWMVPTGPLAYWVPVRALERAVRDLYGDQFGEWLRMACAVLLNSPGDDDPITFLGAAWALTAIAPPHGATRDPVHSLPLVSAELSRNSELRVRLRPHEALAHPILAPWIGGPTLPHYMAATMAAGSVWACEARSAPIAEGLEMFAVGGQLAATATLTFSAGHGEPYMLTAKLHYGCERPVPRSEPEVGGAPCILAGLQRLGAIAREYADPASDGEVARELVSKWKAMLGASVGEGEVRH